MQPVSGVLTTRGRGRGPWKEGQEFTELRRPRTLPSAIGPKSGTESSTAPADPGAQGDAVTTSRSRLSADAKEFVPKGYSVDQYEEAGGGGDAYTAEPYTVPEHLTENFLSDVIHDLTLNPGHFNSTIGIMTDLLIKDIGDSDLYESVINNIVEKSIIYPNFRYNGARVLCKFRNALPSTLQHDFRNLLLKKCQEENVSILKNCHKNHSQTQGFALFLAELYIQMDVTVERSQRISILGAALYEVMKTLLGTETSENIKCVCQVLKLSGLALDEQDTLTMDAVFERLSEIKSTCANENTCFLIGSVIKLRQNAWRPPTALPEAPVCSIVKDDLLPFYLPNGGTLSAEESRFLEDNVLPSEEYDDYSDDVAMCSSVSNFEGDGEEEEEFDKAFEAFLAYSHQAKNLS